MGKKLRDNKRNEIINSACEVIYKNIDELLPGKRQELEIDVENIERRDARVMLEVTENCLRMKKNERVKSWIRDKVINDYKYLTSIMNKKFILDAEEEERNDLFTFFIMLRNKSLESFYNMDNKQENAMKSINAFLKTGKLQYQYEKLCDDFLQIKYKEDHVKDSIFEIVPELTSAKIQDAEKAKIAFVTSFPYGKCAINDTWNNLLDSLWDIYSSIRAFEKTNDKRILGVVRFVDAISGIIRDVLVALGQLSMETDEQLPEKIADEYICAVKKYILSPVELERTRYPLFENYLIHISMISLIGERKEWIFLQSFLLQEIIDGVEPKKTDKYNKQEKVKQVEQVLCWFIQHRKIPLYAQKEILLNATYTECFMYKKIPKELKRHGINHFLKFIAEDKGLLYLNMNREELFYYLKILRGIAREQGELNWYVRKEQMLIKIYEMEMELFGNANEDGFVGKWVEAMLYGIREIGKLLFLDGELNN